MNGICRVCGDNISDEAGLCGWCWHEELVNQVENSFPETTAINEIIDEMVPAAIKALNKLSLHCCKIHTIVEHIRITMEEIPLE